MKKHIIKIARQLRRNQTAQENLLWARLRNRKLKGFKFLRQHPIVYGGSETRPLFFVVDFYCAEKKLVLEIDGGYHQFQKKFDRDRDFILKELGLLTLRIKNEELADMEETIRKVEAVLLEPNEDHQFCEIRDYYV